MHPFMYMCRGILVYMCRHVYGYTYIWMYYMFIVVYVYMYICVHVFMLLCNVITLTLQQFLLFLFWMTFRPRDWGLLQVSPKKVSILRLKHHVKEKKRAGVLKLYLCRIPVGSHFRSRVCVYIYTFFYKCVYPYMCLCIYVYTCMGILVYASSKEIFHKR